MDHVIQTISDLEKKVAEYEANAVRLKTTINELCGMANIPPRYQSADLQLKSQAFAIRSDQFHGRPTATCVREYLEMRKRSDLGPASLNEIFDALVSGGYEFNTKSDQVSRISLNNQLGKNPVFYRLPNKQWGLLEWYPKARPSRPSTPDDDEAERQALIEARLGSGPPSEEELSAANEKPQNQE